MLIRLLRLSVAIALFTAFAAAARPSLAAGITVHFDKDLYLVNGPGEDIQAQILIDTDAVRPGDQPVAVGLDTYAFLMSFNPAKGDVDSLLDVVVPAETDFFGFSPGAFVTIAPAGEVGVHANVDQFNNPLLGYHGTLLATVTLTNLATGPDMYPLFLDFNQDLGENEQFFVDLDGAVLDPMIMFVPSKVMVIPEPSSAALALISILSLVGWRKRLRQR